jgi:MOSC domain-containing protein YiiM
VAGRGIRGDRYFDYRADFKGQITFFAEEVYHGLRRALGIWDKPPSVFRRNVITRGVDLNDLIGRTFEVQGVRFLGVESCKPCYWMDAAFGPGAEAALAGRGGLRARILTDGVLRVTAVTEPT